MRMWEHISSPQQNTPQSPPTPPPLSSATQTTTCPHTRNSCTDLSRRTWILSPTPRQHIPPLPHTHNIHPKNTQHCETQHAAWDPATPMHRPQTRTTPVTRKPCSPCTDSLWPPHITYHIQTPPRTCSRRWLCVLPKCWGHAGAYHITLSRTTITQGLTSHTSTGVPLRTRWGSGGSPQGRNRSLEAHTSFIYTLPVS